MRPFGGGLHLLIIPMLLAAAPPKQTHVDASIRHLRLAVVTRSDGAHLLFLAALRQLRDPSLRSFYLQLAQHGDPGAQIHAVLGLAELDPSGHIDPWLVSQLDDPAARYATIDNALQLDLIDTPQIKELLGWDDLETKSGVMLMAELLQRAEPVDQEALAVLAESQDLNVAGLASCLLTQLGNESVFGVFESKLAFVPTSQRGLVERGLVSAIGVYELSSMIDWIVKLVQQPDCDESLVADGSR